MPKRGNIIDTRERGPASPRRVLYDMSYTCSSGKTSGIERVVRSIHRQGQASHQEDPPFVPVFAYDHQLYLLAGEAKRLLERTAELERDIVSHLPAIYRRVARLVCRLIPSMLVKSWLLPASGHLGVFKSWHRQHKKRAFRRAAACSTAVEVGEQDILLLPDAYWAQPNIWPAAEHAKRTGALIGAIVYDLIPLATSPEEKPNAGFLLYLEKLLDNADLIFTISESVRQQLREYCLTNRPDQDMCVEMRTLPLGCEVAEQPQAVRELVQRPFSKTSAGTAMFLCVGTFDPRKNHHFLLTAFESLWASGQEVSLFLVGRVGWKCQDILRRVRKHPEYGRRLFAVHDASDEEVNYCYKQSQAVVTASSNEGFGLPIVEALHHRKMVLASDIESHREVGRDECQYFGLECAENLSRLIREIAESGFENGSESQAGTQLRSWKDCFCDCRQSLMDGWRTQYEDRQRPRTPTALAKVA